MYNGSHAAPAKSRYNSRKTFLLLISLVLLIAIAAGGTFAYFKAQTPEVSNSFSPGTVPIIPDEEFDGKIKSRISVKNTGNVPALIRVALVINPLDEFDSIDVSRPVELNIPINTADWTEIGGYYYCNSIVAPGSSAPNLISGQVTVTGYEVDVLAQSVQASGSFNNQAPEELAWNVSFTGSGWTAKSA